MRDPSPELAQSSLPAGDMLLWDPPWGSPWSSPYGIRSRLAAANPFDRRRRGGSESLRQFLLSSSFKDRAQPASGGWTGIRGRRRRTSRPRPCASWQRKGENSVLGVGRPGSRVLSRSLRVFSKCPCAPRASVFSPVKWACCQGGVPGVCRAGIPGFQPRSRNPQDRRASGFTLPTGHFKGSSVPYRKSEAQAPGRQLLWFLQPGSSRQNRFSCKY